MGNDCKNIQNHPLASQFSIIQPIQHPALGSILYLKSESMHFSKAVKKVPYDKDMYGVEKIRERVELMKECQSVTTLVKIYDYDVIEDNSEGAALWSNIPSQTNCQHSQYPFILMHFQYLPSDNTLDSILQSRLMALQKNQRRLGNELTGKIRNVKMCDYLQIDELQPQERQMLNCFYQEIEVVRMMDHLIGALFFLHHYDIPHGAVRPNCILTDEEGKYLLVDRELFDRNTNYQEAQLCIKTRNKNMQFQFLAPQWLLDLNQGCPATFCDHEKSDIFCVGLMAVHMCLLDREDLLFSYNFKNGSISFKEEIIQKWLTQIQRRYSPQFSLLLSSMLQTIPDDRIDFVQLIDRLSPILSQNLTQIKELYHPTKKASEKKEYQTDRCQNNLKRETEKDNGFLRASLIDLEERFQRVMNNRTILLHRPVDQKTLRQEEEKILEKLKQIQLTKTAFQSTTARKHNPQHHQSPMVNYFNLSYQKPTQKPTTRHSRQQIAQLNPRIKEKSGDAQRKKYVSGRQLQAIVWREYEDMKSRRSPN